jgi:hypothetical protein
MGGDIEMHHSAAMMSQNHKNKQPSKACGGHHEKVRRDPLLHVIAEKSTPSLGRWFVLTGHVLGDGSLGHIDSQFKQFPMETRRSPERLG